MNNFFETDNLTGKLIDLTAEEISKLKRKRLNTIVFSVFTLAGFGEVLNLLRLVPAISTTVLLVFFIIIVLMLAVIAFISVRNLGKDIREGKKLCSEGTVTKKRKKIRSDYNRNYSNNNGSGVSYVFYVTVNGHEFKVQQSLYKLFHVGKNMKLEVAPSSKEVFHYSEQEGIRSKQSNVKEEFLNNDDIALLKKKRNWKIVRVFLFILLSGILISIILVIAVVFLFRFEALKEYLPTASFVLVNIVPLAIVILLLFRMVKVFVLFGRDINSGVKEVFSAPVDELVESNAKVKENGMVVASTIGEYYYVMAEGKYLEVSKEQLGSTGENLTARINRAKNSGIILNVEVVN